MAYRISVSIRRRLRAVIAERNAPKARFGAQIVLLSADGVGTSAIMRQTGKSKTCVGLAAVLHGRGVRRLLA